MNYLRALSTRWSRRDWLAVVVVALVAALLVGTTLLVVTAGEQSSTLAADFEANATVTQHDSLEVARNEAGGESVVLPTATATSESGESKRVVGIPNSSTVDFDLPPPPDKASGPVDSQAEWQIDGEKATKTITVSPGGDAGILPSSWIRVQAELLETTGETGALVIEKTDTPTGDEGSPLVSVLSFFLEGMNNVIGILIRGVVIAGLIIAVTISSVVQMVISDRELTIRVARATGAAPRRIYLPLAARAGLLTAVGASLGYAIGVIVPNIAINVAVFLGFPTTLSLQVTARVAVLLFVMLGVLTMLGGISGYVTAHAATAVPVARFQPNSAGGAGSHWDRIPGFFQRLGRPELLASRTIIPTTATLSAFAMIVLLIGSLGGVGASFATDGTTITDPDAKHPVGSQIPESYAGAVDDSGAATSPEILLFGYSDGEPYLARGVNYDSFAAVTDADLITGRSPSTADEATVGIEAADTLDLEQGDELVMGGSTEAGVAQVTIVGIYETDGIDDHQLLVPLETARHLTAVKKGQVNVIRTNAAVPVAKGGTETVILGINAPRYSEPGAPISISATVWNPGDKTEETTISVTLDEGQTEQSVTVQPKERRTVTVELDGPTQGEYEIAVGPIRQPITITGTPPVNVAYPDEVRPSDTVQIRVTDTNQNPIETGTVSLANRTTSLNGTGTAWIQAPERAGAHEIVVRTENGKATRNSVRVTETASHTLSAKTTLNPSEPTIHVRPSATVRVRNPWEETIELTLVVEGPGTKLVEQVALGPGDETELTGQLQRRPPGEYTVQVSGDGRVLSTERYQVSGDERLGSALAASGHYGGGGGLGSAIEYSIGNLSVLLAALVGLTAVTIIGAMSSVLARAVRGKRQTIGIYRATGASHRRILKIVLLDAARIGTISSLLALGIGIVVTSMLAELGQLTAFGIALDPRPSTMLAIGLLVGGISLTLLAAVVVTVSIVQIPVTELLSGSSQSVPHTTKSTQTSANHLGDGQEVSKKRQSPDSSTATGDQ